VDRMVREGTGSSRQRAAYERSGSLREVALDAVRATVGQDAQHPRRPDR